MRQKFGHLLTGVLFTIWCAALSGMALPAAPQPLLVLHLVSSVGSLASLAVFLGRHWWSRRDTLGQHHSTSQGYIALLCIVLLALSGLALLHWTNVTILRVLHVGATIGLLGVLTIHLSWRTWQTRLPSHLPRLRSRAILNWLVGGMASAIFVAFFAGGSQASATDPSPIIPVAPASLGSGHLLVAPDCSPCHSAITQHWQTSAHAHAATEAYYQAVTTLFIEERGPEAVRYCATCHNPIGLMQGEIEAGSATPAITAGGAAYTARKLGVALPISPRAAEGVTCALCHQAAQVSASPLNGSLSLVANLADMPTDALAQLALRAVPTAHTATLLPSVIQQAELCGSCHNLRLPDSTIALEPTYDEWRASPYPERAITCQTCHMPQVIGSKADSGPAQMVGAHGNLPGVASSLPGLADDTTLLRGAATLEVQVTPDATDPAGLTVTVIITNSGAGHHLPTGASDLRQMWLELTLRDAAGQVMWSSGVLDEYGALDPSAVQFRKVLGDANGRPIDLHRIWIATQVLSDTSLRPLETRQIRYPISPAAGGEAAALTVRLLYRDVSQAFAEFALNRAAPDLPTREIARINVDLK